MDEHCGKEKKSFLIIYLRMKKIWQRTKLSIMATTIASPFLVSSSIWPGLSNMVPMLLKLSSWPLAPYGLYHKNITDP